MNNQGFSDNTGQTHMFTSFPDTHQDDADIMNNDINIEQQKNLLDENFSKENNYSVWQIEYYQKYFNVSTNDVISRIIGSIVPSFGENSLLNKIRPNPDLYGPFWISTTLIFTIAIAGNIVSYMRNFGSSYTWQTDFHKVTTSAAAIILYSWVLPAVLYILMRWRQNRAEFEFIEILCIYGYSLSIYIPISVLWLIHVSFIQWLLVIVAILLSGSVLFLNFWPAFSQDENKKVSFGIMLLILISHALLGIGFMMYFFHYPKSDNNNVTTKTVSTIVSTVANALNQTVKNTN